MKEDNGEEVEPDSEVIEGSVTFQIENSADDISSPRIPTCPECPRIFPSLKSLYGHLRSHPNRGYRGAIQPRINFKRAQPKPKAKIAKRGRTELEMMTEAAEVLASLCTSDEIEVSEPGKTYRCSTCDKAFATHQALGGHRANHKLKNISEVGPLVEHKCEICTETFATGQALGGHMRRHFTVKLCNLKKREVSSL